MQDKVVSLKVVMFSDLNNADAYDCFGSVSYGDAMFTLVEPGQLINELNEVYENDPEMDDSEAQGVQDLIEELNTIPDGVFVALEG